MEKNVICRDRKHLTGSRIAKAQLFQLLAAVQPSILLQIDLYHLCAFSLFCKWHFSKQKEALVFIFQIQQRPSFLLSLLISSFLLLLCWGKIPINAASTEKQRAALDLHWLWCYFVIIQYAYIHSALQQQHYFLHFCCQRCSVVDAEERLAWVKVCSVLCTYGAQVA